jgi:CHASE1-domain containing sensor protein
MKHELDIADEYGVVDSPQELPNKVDESPLPENITTDSTKNDDDTLTSSSAHKGIFTPNRRDLLFVLLFVIGAILCLVTAVLSYVLVDQSARRTVQVQLDSLAQNSLYRIKTAINNTQVYIATTTMFVKLNVERDLDFYTEYTPFMYATGSPPEFTTVVLINNVVPGDQRDAFVAKMRTRGPDFLNYNITARTATNAVIPAPVADVYYPAIGIVPLDNGTRVGLGFDQGSEAKRNATLNRAIRNRAIASTAKTTFSFQLYTKVGCSIYSPVFYANGSIAKLVIFSFKTGDMLQNAMSDMLSSVTVSVLDTNETDPNTRFLYNSNQYNGTDASYLPMTYQQNDDMINNSQFTSSVQVVFGDRLWKVFFIATPSFISLYTGFEKYIGIIVSVVVCVIWAGVCLVLSIATKLEQARRARQRSQLEIENLRSLIPLPFMKLSDSMRSGEFKSGRYKKNTVFLMHIKVSNYVELTKACDDDGLMRAELDMFRIPMINLSSHKGFAYACNGDHMIAIFYGNSVFKYLEKIREIKMENNTDTTKYQIVVHKTNVLAGAISESRRTVPVLVTNQIGIMHEISNELHEYDNHVLITEDVISFNNDLKYSVVGSVSGKRVYVYNLITEKKNSDKLTDQAMEFVISKEYTRAFDLLQNSNLDIASLTRYKKKWNLAKKITQAWGIEETLSYVQTFESFMNFCERERSSENLNMWRAIQEFRELNEWSSDKLRQSARTIHDKFLLDNINTNLKNKGPITTAITNNNTVITTDLFNEIKSELELLMKDTHNRYKQDPLFIDALCDVITSK